MKEYSFPGVNGLYPTEEPTSAYGGISPAFLEANAALSEDWYAALDPDHFLFRNFHEDVGGFDVTVYYMRHEGDRALEQANKTIEIEPSLYGAITLAYAFNAAGEQKKEIEQWVKVFQLTGRHTRAKEATEAFKKGGYAAFLREEARSDEASGSYVDAADDYAQLGNKDATFALLEKAFRKHEFELFMIKSDPVVLDNLSAPTRAMPTCYTGWDFHSKTVRLENSKITDEHPLDVQAVTERAVVVRR